MPQDPAGMLQGERARRRQQLGEGLGAAGEALQDVDPEGPVLVEEVEPAHRLALAQQRETAVPALLAELVERLTPHERTDRGGDQRRGAVEEEGGGRVPILRALAQPPQGEGLAAVGRGRGLDPPGAGDVRLGGGGGLVLLPEAAEEPVLEGVGGEGGRIFGITHEGESWGGWGPAGWRLVPGHYFSCRRIPPGGSR